MLFCADRERQSDKEKSSNKFMYLFRIDKYRWIGLSLRKFNIVHSNIFFFFLFDSNWYINLSIFNGITLVLLCGKIQWHKIVQLTKKNAQQETSANSGKKHEKIKINKKQMWKIEQKNDDASLVHVMRVGQIARVWHNYRKNKQTNKTNENKQQKQQKVSKQHIAYF